MLQKTVDSAPASEMTNVSDGNHQMNYLGAILITNASLPMRQALSSLCQKLAGGPQLL